MAQMHDDLNFGINLSSKERETADSKNGSNIKNQGNTHRSSGSEDRALQNGQIGHIGKSDYDLSAAAHPLACIFTFAFKLSAFLIYFFGSIFFSSIIIFIIVVLLSSLDFWTVKNVTGRLLVGLRWRNQYDEKGNQIWKFQSRDKEFTSNPVDKTFFWTSQFTFTILWTLFFILKVLGLSFYWALLVFINLSLCATNLYGYYKCRGCNCKSYLEHSKKIENLSQEYKKKGIMHLAGKFM